MASDRKVAKVKSSTLILASCAEKAKACFLTRGCVKKATARVTIPSKELNIAATSDPEVGMGVRMRLQLQFQKSAQTKKCLQSSLESGRAQKGQIKRCCSCNLWVVVNDPVTSLMTDHRMCAVRTFFAGLDSQNVQSMQTCEFECNESRFSRSFLMGVPGKESLIAALMAFCRPLNPVVFFLRNHSLAAAVAEV